MTATKCEFGSLESEYESILDKDEAFVRIGATFSIRDEQGSIFTEPHFPVVELAAQLHRWLMFVLPQERDFEFNSLSTPDPGWVWIRWTGTGWKLGSNLQERTAKGELNNIEVRALVENFVLRLTASAKQTLGADISAFIT
jgi:hypothetical protein